jgi:hypothetical protein
MAKIVYETNLYVLYVQDIGFQTKKGSLLLLRYMEVVKTTPGLQVLDANNGFTTSSFWKVLFGTFTNIPLISYGGFLARSLYCDN